MRAGDTRLLVLSPEQAWGARQETLIEVRPLLETHPMREKIDKATFCDRYIEDPEEGKNVTDRFWRWTVFVERVEGVKVCAGPDAATITVVNAPKLGHIAKPYHSWEAEIVGIDSFAASGVGEIKIRHRLSDAQTGTLLGKDARGTFIITSVDTDEGVYRKDYNPEAAGKTVTYKVTLLSVRKK